MIRRHRPGGRADCENRIKELKYDFGADSFCLNDFWATEACLSTAMLAYNLMSLFRQAIVKTTVEHVALQTVCQGCYLTHEGRKDILKLALAMRNREWFTGLWDRSKTFDLPVHFSPVFSTQVRG